MIKGRSLNSVDEVFLENQMSKTGEWVIEDMNKRAEDAMDDAVGLIMEKIEKLSSIERSKDGYLFINKAELANVIGAAICAARMEKKTTTQE